MDEVSFKKGKTLELLIKASQEDKKEFDEIGKEIEAYGHMADQKRIHEGMGLEAELWFKITVGMTAQAIDLMGPYLYPTNPYRSGKVRRSQFIDPMAQELRVARNGLMMEYLNYTPNETDLYGESIRAINQCMPYGMGVTWTGFNQRKGLVHSVWGDICDFFVDPDACTWHEVNWVARKRYLPRWQLLDRYPKAQDVIAALEADKKSKSNLGKHNDQIVYYEVWMRVGIHRYVRDGLPQMDAEGNPVQLTDAPRKFCVSENGKLLSEENWEVPLFMDDLWPCQPLWFIDNKDSIWPVSPLRAALPFQRALNWLFVFYMTKIRFCSRSIFAHLETAEAEIPADHKKEIEFWNDMPFITIRNNSGAPMKIGDLFQQLNLDPNLANFEQAHAIIKREYQEHSGVYDILHYGQGDTQDRSATATQFREKTAKTRINYRLDRVIAWQSQVARTEALCARFLHTPEQIDEILGMGAGQIWGQIMPPQQPQMPGMMGMGAGMGAGMGMAPAPDPMAVDFKGWLLETDYSVVSTSMRRHDIETKIEAETEMMTRTVPALIGSVDLNDNAIAFDMQAEYYQDIGASDEIVAKLRARAEEKRQQAQMMLQQQQMMALQGQQPVESFSGAAA